MKFFDDAAKQNHPLRLLSEFLEREEEKWKCPECGGTICCHDGICYSCGLKKLKKGSYRQEVIKWLQG